MNWNNLKFIQKTPEQPTGKAQNQGTTESSHTGHCTRTAGSADVKVKHVQKEKWPYVIINFK
jgi:hypothetical protein